MTIFADAGSHGGGVHVFYSDSNMRTVKRRPALVVQADNPQTGLPQVILAVISSNLDARSQCRIYLDYERHDPCRI